MLPTPLYLDTARLGTMSPDAQRLHNEFVRLAVEQPSSLYVEKFLKDGFSAWPAANRRRYPELALWHGITDLQDQLAQAIAPRTPGRILLASRASALMKLAARRQCETCRHILTTDLSWPPYQRILARRAKRTGRTLVTRIRVRRRILQEQMTAEELVELLTERFVRHDCDGLFLPIVDSRGIKVPLARIVEHIRRRADLRFTVGDAAQALGHVSFGPDAAVCDMLIAGCHKWLRAYLPLGVAWENQRHTLQPQFDSDEDSQFDRTSDPLSQFTHQLAGGSLWRHAETVNLAPLFACRGAVQNIDAGGIGRRANALRQRSDFNLSVTLARASGWEPLIPAQSFRTSIILLRCRRLRGASPDDLRRAFLDQGVILTAYAGGLVRLSLPLRTLRLGDWHRLQRALSAVSAQPCRPIPSGQLRNRRDAERHRELA